MGVYGIKPAFQRLLGPAAAALARRGVSADALTWSGLACSVAAGAALWIGREGGAVLLVVPVAVLARTAANALDGMVAKGTGTARPFGEVFNETADRAGDAAVFLPMMAVGGVPDALVAGTVALMLVTSFVGLASRAAGGPRVYSGIMGKPDRMLVVGIAAVVAFAVDEAGAVFVVTCWIVLAGAAVTLVQRLSLAHRALR